MAFYSSGVEYGIHSLMCMVDSKGDARDMSVREIAELQSVPYDYLAKIFTRLSKAGLVRSIEGICGVRSVMDMAQQRMEEALGQHTILDLARKMYRKAPDTFVVEVQEWIDARKG